jgi:hypothetical protein
MAAPAQISQLSIASAKERMVIDIDFRVEAADGEVVAIAFELATAIGTLRTTLPAAGLGLAGGRGAGRAPLDLRLLPGGPCTLALTPIGTSGEPAKPARADVRRAGLGHCDGARARPSTPAARRR